jgi:hypothetical protein
MSDWETFLAENEATQVSTLTATLQAIVDEVGPEFCYRDRYGDGCLYVVDDTPACLVGVALHRLGMPVEDLRDWDNEHSDSTISVVGFDILSPRAVALLAEAQTLQDDGDTWALAVANATESVPV